MISSQKQIPKVSIVLPFYNAEDTLDRAISSIANQTFSNFECILVNNNSVDESVSIARSWTEKDARFRLIHENKKGVVHASNAGTSLARGEFVARMDADDWAFPEKLEKQLAFFEKNPRADALATQVEHVAHDENTKGFERFVEWNNSITSGKDLLNKRFIEMPLVNPTMMWRRSSSLKYGMYQKGNFPEDYEMWLRWMDMGARIYKLPEVLLKWYDSDTRLTRTNRTYSDASFYSIKSLYLAKWLKSNNHFHPRVAIWGASRISRRRARLLEKYNIDLYLYIDTKKTRQIDQPIVYYKNIPSADEIFILVYIKQMDAREEIQEYLHGNGYVEGVNYLLVS